MDQFYLLLWNVNKITAIDYMGTLASNCKAQSTDQQSIRRREGGRPNRLVRLRFEASLSVFLENSDRWWFFQNNTNTNKKNLNIIRICCWYNFPRSNRITTFTFFTVHFYMLAWLGFTFFVPTNLHGVYVWRVLYSERSWASLRLNLAYMTEKGKPIGTVSERVSEFKITFIFQMNQKFNVCKIAVCFFHPAHISCNSLMSIILLIWWMKSIEQFRLKETWPIYCLYFVSF